MKAKAFFAWITITTILQACSPTPQPIEFGSDVCAFCKMTIVQMPFAAELVSHKGKAFKFDAIECMVHYLQQAGEEDFSLFLVRDYLHPEQWVSAKEAAYLISENLPSPMGAYLSAWRDESAARTMHSQKGGHILTWEEMKNRIAR